MKLKLTFLIVAWSLLTFSFFLFIGSRLYLSDQSQFSRTQPETKELVTEIEKPEIAPAINEALGLPTQPVSQEYLMYQGETVELTLAVVGGVGQTSFEIVDRPASGDLGELVGVSSNQAKISFTSDHSFLGDDQLTFRALRGGAWSPLATIKFKVVREILPWSELNAPDLLASEVGVDIFDGAPPESTLLDVAVAGLPYWSKIARRVIISSSSDGISNAVYPSLMAQLPSGLELIGGIKTTGVFPMTTPPGGSPVFNFTDPQSWLTIRDLAEAVVAQTGTNIVVLENETILYNYNFYGYQPIDYAELAQSLIPLAETGIEFWWWLPNYFDWPVTNPNFNLATESTQFINTIKSVLPNSVFITQYSARYYWRDDAGGVRRNEMINLVGLDHTIEDLWLGGDYSNCPSGQPPESECLLSGMRVFSPAEALTLTQALPDYAPLYYRSGQFLSDIAIFYPNNKWVTTAREVEALLPDLAPVVAN